MSNTSIAQKISVFLLGLSLFIIAFILLIGMGAMLEKQGFSASFADWFNRTKWVLGFAIFIAVSNFLIVVSLEPTNDD